KAAMDAATEIGLAVVTTTMTLVAVFLPTAFMGGMAGQFFKEFGWTAATAVLASLAVARLITPMLCARFLQSHPQSPPSWIMDTYLDIARLALKHRLITSLCAALFFVGSILALNSLPREFVPASDNSSTQVIVELAPGTPLSTTNAIAELVRQKISVIPEITNIFTTVGTGNSDKHRGPGVSDFRNANLTIDLPPVGQRERSQAEIEVEIRSILGNVPGARFQVGSRQTGEILLINLTSEDAQLLHQTAQNAMTELRGVPGLGNVISNASLLRPEIFIRPNMARAAELGVTASAIGETVQVATAGDYSAALAQMNLPQRQVDIRVQLPLSTRQDLAAIEQLRVPGAHGLVPLAAIAEVSMGSGPAQISRFDRSRNIRIEVELGNLLLGDANALVRELPSLKRLPLGVSWVDTGDSKMMNDMFSSFGVAMVTGLICVFMVLVLLFKDFMQPITILAALPLTIGGAVFALFIVDASFSLPAVIGLLMLMGIATKNSILLVDYAVVAMRNGMDVHDALLDACAKRARPIVMTTLAMTAGMLPVAMGVHEGSSFRMPMGIVVIGGLLTSTVLSLIVVPVVFTYVLQAKELLARILPHGHAVETAS
ncbi:MAG TPA: RND transporter, partial [Gammaproteobacteria bacterium]|nr:RND transporter [Gammaproteobacteria bacterium]